MRRILLSVLYLKLVIVAGACVAQSSTLTVDLSQTLVVIDATYTGSELIAFGVTPERDEFDLIVLMTGPRFDTRLLSKKRRFGMWINQFEETFYTMPGFFLRATTRPINDLLGEKNIETHDLNLESYIHSNRNNPDHEKNIEIVKSLLTKDQLYVDNSSSLLKFKNNLFRLPITLPSQSPAGLYTLKVLAVRDQKVVEQTSATLWVRKEGVDALISETAHNHSILYGTVWALISFILGIIIFLAFNLRKLR